MKKRVVTDDQKSLLRSHLTDYLNELKDTAIKPVLYPNTLFEFG